MKCLHVQLQPELCACDVEPIVDELKSIATAAVSDAVVAVERGDDNPIWFCPKAVPASAHLRSLFWPHRVGRLQRRFWFLPNAGNGVEQTFRRPPGVVDWSNLTFARFA